MKKLIGVIVGAFLVAGSSLAEVGVEKIAEGFLVEHDSTRALAAGVEVRSGDILVFASSMNRFRIGEDQLDLVMVSSDGGELGSPFVYDARSACKAEAKAYEVRSPGTFSFVIKKKGIPFVTYGVYLLRSTETSGYVRRVAIAKGEWGPDFEKEPALDYGVFKSGESGVVIEAVSSYATIAAVPEYLKEHAYWGQSQSTGRAVSYGSFVGNGTPWGSVYQHEKDSTKTGEPHVVVVGMAFAEAGVQVQAARPSASPAPLPAPVVSDTPETDSAVEAAPSEDTQDSDGQLSDPILFGILGLSGILLLLSCRRSA